MAVAASNVLAEASFAKPKLKTVKTVMIKILVNFIIIGLAVSLF